MTTARSPWSLGIPLCGAVLLAACAPGPRWNVLLVTFDTTRADALACYGNRRVATPVLDALAAEGVLFEQAHSSIPLTLPSHTTILTGVYPPRHGVRDNGLFVVPPEVETLAERLGERGWATAAAVGGFPLVGKFGIDQGFDFFDDHLTRGNEDLMGRRVRPHQGIFFDERRAQRVNEAVYPWLAEHASDPFFLWVHYYDPHQPLDPPNPYNQLYADDLYAGEIAYADESLGTLIDDLRRLGVWDETLVVFTADHGEGRGEHRELTHSYLLYDSTLHVPLILRLPPAAHPPRARRVAEGVRHVDIVPTVLDLLGLPAPESIDGRSLVPYLEGGRPAPVVHYAETLSPRLSHGWGELRALYAEEWKYVHGPRPELFHLPTDPGEHDNRFAAEPEVAARLEARLASFLRERAAAAPQRAAAPDADTRRRLEALGYIQAGGAEDIEIREVLSREGVAPQDRVERTSELSRIKELLAQREALAARELAQQLVTEDPESPYYLELLAMAEGQLGRYDEAAATIERLLASGGSAGSGRLLLELGWHLVRSGRSEEGLERLRQGVEREPSAQGLFLLATVAQELGRRDEAADALREAVASDPAYGPAVVALGVVRAEAGEAAEAERLFRQAVARDPYYAKGHYNLGAHLLAAGGAAEAVACFERAAELAPDYLQALQAAGVAYLRLGQRGEAQGALARLEALSPDSAEGRSLRQLLAQVDAS